MQKIALLFASLGLAQSLCYLLDADATCAICWKTIEGVTKMGECGDSVKVTWDKPLPQEMTEGIDYPVEWGFDASAVPNIGTPAIPHANIHSCIANKGACTPFVSNTPGLSTHTPAITDASLVGGKYVFASVVNLKADQYTIIAHTRMWVGTGVVDGEGKTKYPEKWDTAIGTSRTVELPAVEASESAIVTAGVAGGVVVLFVIALGFSVKSGKLNPEKFLQAFLDSPLVSLIALVVGLGDVIAFTFTVVNMTENPTAATADILPISILVLAIGWVISLLKFLEDALKIYDQIVLGGARSDQKIAAVAAHYCVMQQEADKKKAGQTKSTKSENKDLKRQLSTKLSGNMGSEMLEAGKKLAINARKVRSLYYTVLTIPLEQIPLIVLTAYLMVNADVVVLSDPLTLFFSSGVFGANVMRLLSFPKIIKERDEVIKKFSAMADATSPSTQVSPLV